MYDAYGAPGGGNMGFAETTDFITFKNLGLFNAGAMKGTNFNRPKHGAVTHLTLDELKAAVAHWKVDLKIDVPPGGTLITGYSAGIDGETIDIAGLFTTPNPASKAVVNVAGGQVEVELSYLGPLPD